MSVRLGPPHPARAKANYLFLVSNRGEGMMEITQEGKARNLLALLPNSAICFNFLRDGTRLKKSTWMVPHVVRHKDDTDVVSWRCNWGNTCESDCFYARAREQVT